mmetsp:Transcript_87662/g.263578  ORF Transcript_87662/g.263578 Transcript_87662/m.263578 type:complete len:274 (-) Transcript_87662:408-1229(-)
MAAPKVARQMAAHDPPCQPGETAPASWELAPELQSSREPLARMDAALDAPDEWTKESVLKWGHAHYGKNAWSRQAWSAWADEQLALHNEEQLIADDAEVLPENAPPPNFNVPVAAPAPVAKPVPAAAAPPAPPVASAVDATKSAYIFNFGKKAGETLATVWATDKGYLRYMIQEKVRCLRACALPARAAAGCARRLVCVALTARVPCGRKSTRSRAWPTFAPRSPPRASSTSTRARSTTRPRCQTRSASCARTPRWCVCARRRSPKSPSVSTT